MSTDLYKILNIESSATQTQIREAYKRESLLSHPDRFPVPPHLPAELETAKIRFQLVSDAYNTLIDPVKRSEYDSHFASGSAQSNPFSAKSFFQSAFNSPPPDSQETFSSVFETLLRPEIDRVIPMWTYVGLAAGAALGFITANLPGLAVGAVVGRQMGQVRDAKGKSVAAAFSGLSNSQRIIILKALASKVLGSTTNF